MGIQKAVFKFIHMWATSHQKGTALQLRMSQLLKAVQSLRLSYVPCRPYKDVRFGGYTAESYRAMTFLCLWLYCCLEETSLAPPPPHSPPINDDANASNWLLKDNIAWLEVRDVDFDPEMGLEESRVLVARLMASPGGAPPVVSEPRSPIPVGEIRELVHRMFMMFRNLFATDLSGPAAHHRSTASVISFLCQMEMLDKRLYPRRSQQIWLVKFNFLGLLRACSHFLDFQHVKNLYEGV
jgi:hypothetical protein